MPSRNERQWHGPGQSRVDSEFPCRHEEKGSGRGTSAAPTPRGSQMRGPWRLLQPPGGRPFSGRECAPCGRTPRRVNRDVGTLAAWPWRPQVPVKWDPHGPLAPCASCSGDRGSSLLGASNKGEWHNLNRNQTRGTSESRCTQSEAAGPGPSSPLASLGGRRLHLMQLASAPPPPSCWQKANLEVSPRSSPRYLRF